MISALQLLGMGGGRKPLSIDQNTHFAKYQDDVLHVYRGIEKHMTLYIDKATKKRCSINYSQFLPTGVSIDTSTWTVEDSSTLVTLSNAANDNTTTEVYVTGTLRDSEVWIKNAIVTDATIPETLQTSILVKTVRVAGV
jgi:hypothetical protein